MRDRSGRWRVGASLLVAALSSAGLVAAGAGSAAAATTLSVPSQYPTISAALAAAVDGDTIQVAPGTYHDNVEYGGKDVRVRATGGPGVTTIDGDGERVVFIGPGGALEGFTITDGGTQTYYGGGAVVVGAGSLIEGNRFIANSHEYLESGAAMYLSDSTATIRRNTFSGNTCSGSTTSSSGVVVVDFKSAPRIENNVFFDNPCDVDLQISQQVGHVIVVNNTFAGSGGGVAMSIGLQTSSTYTVRNNIVTGQAVGIRFTGSASTSGVDHNLIDGNVYDYAGGPSLTGVNGNIEGDPGFLDLAGRDLRLQPSSPAVDGGNADDTPIDDLDGDPRPVDGADADAIAEVDIGAYERQGDEPPPTPQAGTLDKGWSGDGISLYPSRYNIALGPYGDGATYVGSYKVTDGNGPMRVTKLTSTGAPAPGWGSAGYVLRAFEPGGAGTSFPTHVVPVGLRITVVGEHYRDTARLGVARLRSDGSYDPAFSTDGRALYKVFSGEHDIVSAFRADVLTGGKIGLAVAAFDYSSQGELVFTAQAMLRLNSDGTPDRTFSGDGVAVVPNSWSDIRWMPSGASFVGVQGSVSHQVRKLLPSGQLDTRFSGDGIVTAACGTHRGANMAIDPSNRPVLMCVKVSGTSTVLAMYRFTTTGAFDATYSGDGKTSWVIPNAAELRAHFDQTAKPWVAAAGPGATTTLRLYTLSSSGAPDTSFSGDGATTVTLPWNVDLSGVWRSGNRLFVTNFVGTVNVGIVGVKI